MDHYHSTTDSMLRQTSHIYNGIIRWLVAKMDGMPTGSRRNLAVLLIQYVMSSGEVLSIVSKVQRCKASQGQKTYEQNRIHCCRHYDRLEKAAFLQYVDRHVREDGWSLDACRGRALRDKIFREDEVTCTKTLYNYVDLGLMETNFIIFLVAFKALSIKLVSQGILTCSYNGSSSLHY